MAEEPLAIFTYRSLPWARARVRKYHACVRCRKGIQAGSECFRPITNTIERGNRLCTMCSMVVPHGR